MITALSTALIILFRKVFSKAVIQLCHLNNSLLKRGSKSRFPIISFLHFHLRLAAHLITRGPDHFRLDTQRQRNNFLSFWPRSRQGIRQRAARQTVCTGQRGNRVAFKAYSAFYLFAMPVLIKRFCSGSDAGAGGGHVSLLFTSLEREFYHQQGDVATV